MAPIQGLPGSTANGSSPFACGLKYPSGKQPSRAEPKPTIRCLICLIQVSCLVPLQFSHKRRETQTVVRIDKFLAANSLGDGSKGLGAQIEIQPFGAIEPANHWHPVRVPRIASGGMTWHLGFCAPGGRHQHRALAPALDPRIRPFAADILAKTGQCDS